MPTPRPTAEQAALAELRSPTCATTTQFFAAHVLESTDGEPHVHGVLLDGDVHQVHFRPQGEDYFLVVMVRATPDGWDILGARASARARVALSIVSETLLAEDITRATGLDLERRGQMDATRTQAITPDVHPLDPLPRR